MRPLVLPKMGYWFFPPPLAASAKQALLKATRPGLRRRDYSESAGKSDATLGSRGLAAR